ncbi:MAG: hypothetical protein DCF22_01690 [Leptolyngbya sp.]|nr:MAG: hypothetical protein DCF22_01690 [Leptolyngbya sp.]
MNQFLRLLLLTPAAFSSVLSLVMVRPAHAANAGWVQVSKDTACLHVVAHTTTQFTCRRVNSEATKVFDITKSAVNARDAAEINTVTSTVFDLTDEESDAAIALFGCDCPACTRSLRQLRSMLS